MNKVNLSPQAKQLTILVPNNKIQVSKQKLEFWIACMCHFGLDSFPILKGFSDEAHGDINECDFWYCTMKWVIWKIYILH